MKIHQFYLLSVVISGIFLHSSHAAWHKGISQNIGQLIAKNPKSTLIAIGGIGTTIAALALYSHYKRNSVDNSCDSSYRYPTKNDRTSPYFPTHQLLGKILGKTNSIPQQKILAQEDKPAIFFESSAIYSQQITTAAIKSTFGKSNNDSTTPAQISTAHAAITTQQKYNKNTIYHSYLYAGNKAYTQRNLRRKMLTKKAWPDSTGKPRFFPFFLFDTCSEEVPKQLVNNLKIALSIILQEDPLDVIESKIKNTIQNSLNIDCPFIIFDLIKKNVLWSTPKAYSIILYGKPSLSLTESKQCYIESEYPAKAYLYSNMHHIKMSYQQLELIIMMNSNAAGWLTSNNTQFKNIYKKLLYYSIDLGMIAGIFKFSDIIIIRTIKELFAKYHNLLAPPDDSTIIIIENPFFAGKNKNAITWLQFSS